MPGFTPVFGGAAIYPSDLTFLSLMMTADVDLVWPNQMQNGEDVAAAIIEFDADAGLSISLDDARQVANGYTILFNNIGAETVSIKNQGGTTLMSVASGEVWQLYLASNATANGVWRVFEYGAGTSSANAGALAGAGLIAITTTLNQNMEVRAVSVDGAIVDSDRAKVVQWESGVGTLTLPDPAAVGEGWFTGVKNAGVGTIDVNATTGDIDGSSSVSIPPGESTYIYSDGTDMFTLGFGQAVNSVFDFISISVAGTGDFVLSGAQLNRVSYRFTGILTGNRRIIVPATIQQYWVDNSTTGAFTLEVTTALGTGVVVPQNQRTILYCDASNVVNAETVVASTPVAINQGGTGATDAVTALANLGGVTDTRQVIAGSGLTGGGDLSADRTFNVGAGTGITVGADAVALDTASTRNTDHAAVNVIAGSGLTGGGDITVDRTLNVGAGTGITVNANDVALDTASNRNVDHSAVTLTAGSGMSGGGDITASRSFDIGAGTGIQVNANDVALDTGSTRNTDHAAVSITGANSIVGGGAITASQALALDGDVGSPGNYYYYGTNSAGVKGFHLLPSAAASRTWQDVTGSRAISTDYTNSTGIEIEVSVSGLNNSVNSQSAAVDGVTIAQCSTNTSTGYMQLSFTVPPGSTYRINGSFAGGSFLWAELRP